MFTTKINPQATTIEVRTKFARFPLVVEAQPDPHLGELLAALSPDTPWSDRKTAACQLGELGSPEALQGLLDALQSDPFWMVRCAIVQALGRVGDPQAIPALQEVAVSDGFQVVRSYAGEAIKRLSQG
jgi:HEAT repeat protein